MELPFLYQDEHVAVVCKPAGVVVNRAETVSSETIQDWWLATLKKMGGGELVFPKDWQRQVPADFTPEFGTPEEIFAERGGIVHRLDKETSGALLLAKHPGSLVNLLLQFRQRKTQKKYTALVHGKFSILEDTVSFPIGRSALQRTKFHVAAEGRAAETTYKVTEFFPHFQTAKLIQKVKDEGKEVKQLKQKVERGYQGFSLVECWPKTGRTHQIRVHFTHLRHPLVADPTYVGSKRLNLDQLWCPRLFLHATTLGWSDPLTGEARSIEAELPADLLAALQFVREE